MHICSKHVKNGTISTNFGTILSNIRKNTNTEEHQNVDVHWVTHLSVENRVSGNHLSSEKPDNGDLLHMENGLCLPSGHEHHLQRENYITLTERAIVEIPSLAFLKPVVCKHIPHLYSKEMREKSEMVLYCIILFNDMHRNVSSS